MAVFIFAEIFYFRDKRYFEEISREKIAFLSHAEAFKIRNVTFESFETQVKSKAKEKNIIINLNFM